MYRLTGCIYGWRTDGIYEINADEIGPSLRWARAEIERIARDGGSGGGGSSSGSSGGGRAPDPVYGDEEPF